MTIFKEIEPLKALLADLRHKQQSIGFVPTMGALHQGHLSLVSKSKASLDLTICSIFINPAQFNNAVDFQKYPVTTANDIKLLVNAGTDILFLPSVEEIYPSGFETTNHYKLGPIEHILEGAHRPGHFQGVCKVVHRLLDITQPSAMFLGQKDYQQCMVLKQLVQSLGLPVNIKISGTIREPSGLAMSSRNLRLSSEARIKAVAIFEALNFINENKANQSYSELEQQARNYLLNKGFDKVDYVTIADAGSLKSMPPDAIWDGKTPLVALVAAHIDDVRLIDNMILS